MKTTIDIPDDILAGVLKYSKNTTKKGAVIEAMQEYIDRRRMAELAENLGTLKGIISREELLRLRKQS